MSEQNKRAVRRLIEDVWNRGNFAVVDALLARDYLGHSSAPIHGRIGYRRFYTALRRAFPNLQVTLEDQIAAGDKVVTRWTARGTHQADYLGIPPTGRQATITGITIDRLADGKVVENWTQTDALALLARRNLLATPGAKEDTVQHVNV